MFESEEIKRRLEEIEDAYKHSFFEKWNDGLSEIAKQVAHGDLLDAYVETLNMEADFYGSGGAHNSDEHKEIKMMQQQCEHWIAQRVLMLSDWKVTNFPRYYKREKK